MKEKKGDWQKDRYFPVEKESEVKGLCLVLLFATSIAAGRLWAQETEKEGEQIQSITEERRELLLYGIDDQVVELIETLTEEKDSVLADEAYAAFKLTQNPKVRTRIFDYFSAIDFPGAREEAIAIVDSFYEQSPQLVSASIRYLTEEAPSGLAGHLRPLIDATDQEIARMAIKGVGLSGGDADAEILLELLDDGDYPPALKPEIILALGDMKNVIAVPRLQEILDDKNENSTWRRYACASLGKIGDTAALPVIERALYDEDAMLRSYAVGALQYFSGDEIEDLLAAALKDSFWRVRVSAAQGLGEIQAREAVPILIFKAEKDPEMNVRIEAVRALGAIADAEALEALREFYQKDLTPVTLRVISAEILAEKDLPGSLELFKAVIDKHWGKDTTRILERTAQILSRTESDLLESFYSRFIDSGEMVVMIYGIRGIARNRILSLREAIEELSGEGNHRSIRKEALAALEQLD